MILKKGGTIPGDLRHKPPVSFLHEQYHALVVVFWGRRPGRNPSSVYYDGHPSYRGTRAIGRRLTGAYIPFHNTAEANVSS